MSKFCSNRSVAREKVAKQCCWLQEIAAVKAYADHHALDQALKWCLALSSIYPTLPPFLFLPSDSRPSYGVSRGRKGLAGGKIDNKAFKASELPTAKPLSRQQGASQPLPSQALQPHQPWQKAGRTICLNNMAESLTQHWNWAIAPTSVMVGLLLALIAQHWAKPWTWLVVKGQQ